jgi:hypothetical protein
VSGTTETLLPESLVAVAFHLKIVQLALASHTPVTTVGV